jgi:endonuclease YncB( thermonuclease family)
MASSWPLPSADGNGRSVSPAAVARGAIFQPVIRFLPFLMLICLLNACSASSGSPAVSGAATPMPAASPRATATAEVVRIPPQVQCQWATVRKVTDGDTIRVDFENGPLNQPVRYIGMDTPETVKPDTPVQPFGPEAAAENARLVSGRRLCLEKDVSERDRYDRLLRYAWLPDGSMVNEILVSEGMATVETVPPDVKYVERFIAAQQQARAAARGMWAP